MPRFHLRTNLQTGETESVPFTAEEETARDAEEATAAIAHQATLDALAERGTSSTDFAAQYQDAITRLNQIIDFQGTPTAAQVYDAVQDVALYLRKTLRYLEAQR